MSTSLKDEAIRILDLQIENNRKYSQTLQPYIDLYQAQLFPVSNPLPQVNSNQANSHFQFNNSNRSIESVYHELYLKLNPYINDEETTYYILDRLDNNDLLAFNSIFKEAVAKIRSLSQGEVSRDDFLYLLLNRVLKHENIKPDDVLALKRTKIGEDRFVSALNKSEEQQNQANENVKKSLEQTSKQAHENEINANIKKMEDFINQTTLNSTTLSKQQKFAYQEWAKKHIMDYKLGNLNTTNFLEALNELKQQVDTDIETEVIKQNIAKVIAELEDLLPNLPHASQLEYQETISNINTSDLSVTLNDLNTLYDNIVKELEANYKHNESVFNSCSETIMFFMKDKHCDHAKLQDLFMHDYPFLLNEEGNFITSKTELKKIVQKEDLLGDLEHCARYLTAHRDEYFSNHNEDFTNMYNLMNINFNSNPHVDQTKLMKFYKDNGMGSVNNKNNVSTDEKKFRKVYDNNKDVFFKVHKILQESIGKFDRGTIGNGIAKKPKKKIHGRGLSTRTLSKNKVYDKIYIDLKKFYKNVLSLKYVNSGNKVPNFKDVIMSAKLKKVIEDILTEKFNQNDYDALDIHDKRIVVTLSRLIGFDKLHDDTLANFQQRYEILCGQIEAGNNSIILRNELKKFILGGIQAGLLPQAEGYKAIVELSL